MAKEQNQVNTLPSLFHLHYIITSTLTIIIIKKKTTHGILVDHGFNLDLTLHNYITLHCDCDLHLIHDWIGSVVDEWTLLLTFCMWEWTLQGKGQERELELEREVEIEAPLPLTVTSRVRIINFNLWLHFETARINHEKVWNCRFCICWEISLQGLRLGSRNGSNWFVNAPQSIVLLASLTALPPPCLLALG